MDHESRKRCGLQASIDFEPVQHLSNPQSGGMFLENIDPAHFDAAFFSTSAADAIAMDPQQRQLLEVVYECLENAGIPLESLSGKSVGCFVGSSSAGGLQLTHVRNWRYQD